MMNIFLLWKSILLKENKLRGFFYENKLPSSFYDSKKQMKKLGRRMETIVYVVLKGDITHGRMPIL